jgi:hypothetical protein
MLARTFAVDALACPGCGERLRADRRLEDPAIVRR